MTDNNKFVEGTGFGGVGEIERLFQQLERHPSRLPSPGTVVNEVSQQLIEELALPELWGAVAQGLVNGDFINGTFTQGPPAGADPLSASNKIEGWEYTESSGTWVTTHGTEANAPDGYGVQFDIVTGSGTEEAYIEQTIAIDRYRPLVCTMYHEGDNANTPLKIAVQFLDADLSTTGSELTATYTSTSAQADRFWRIPPAGARYARVRVGAVTVAAPTNEERTILFITNEQPFVYSVNMSGVFSYASPAASTDYPMPYPSDVIPGGVLKADTRGFVLGISGKTDDTISAGTATLQVENDTQATTPGPSVALSSGTEEDSDTASLDGRSTYDFVVDDELHLELSADGDYASTGVADYHGTARLLYVVHDETDW